MLSSILAQVPWQSPSVDYHAIAPEIVLAGGICLVILVDLFTSETKKWITATLTGFVMLGALLPVLTLAVNDVDVDEFATADGIMHEM